MQGVTGVVVGPCCCFYNHFLSSGSLCFICYAFSRLFPHRAFHRLDPRGVA